MKILKSQLKKLIKEIIQEQNEICSYCKKCPCECKNESSFSSIIDDNYFEECNNKEELEEKTPPGKEKVVKALKKKFPKGSSSPFKIAWAQHNREQ